MRTHIHLPGRRAVTYCKLTTEELYALFRTFGAAVIPLYFLLGLEGHDLDEICKGCIEASAEDLEKLKRD